MTHQPREILFATIVEELDSCKRLYYSLRFLEEYPSSFGTSEGVPAIRESFSLALHNIAKGISDNPSAISDEALLDLLRATQSVANKADIGGRPASELFMSMYSDHSDNPLCPEFGHFWNEVPLPDCIDAVFRAYIADIRSQVHGLLGVEDPSLGIVPGNCAISYYDLSDIAIVFVNEDAADNFAEAHGVDPSDKMYAVSSCAGGGIAWQCA